MIAWLGLAAMWAAVVGLVIGFSAVVLWAVGRVMPLAGRGRRRG